MAMNHRLLRPRASGGGFDPRAISGLGLWLDFADLSTLAQNSNGTTGVVATNDPIGYVGDKSGNGRHFTQAVNNDRPLLGSLNGRPAAVFDGSNDTLLGNAASLNIARNVGGFSAFVVKKGDSALGQQSYVSFSNGTTGLSRFSLTRDGTASQTLVYRRLDGDSVAFLTGALADSTQTEIYYGEVNYASGGADAARLIINGVVEKSATVSGTGNTSDTDGLNIGLGSSGSGTIFFDGIISELLAWPRVLTAAERQAIERYLAAKWGVSL